MDDTKNNNVAMWPSIEDTEPLDEGGPIARTGFSYQDEIAVGFLIEMLESPTLIRVHCETHDDIVLVRQDSGNSKRRAEFVQVKSSEQDKLWSIADLCQRHKARIGTSIYETSLGRDRHQEQSRFRIVTLRPVVKELQFLTFPLLGGARLSAMDLARSICAELNQRVPGIASPKGNRADYWIHNCTWDERHGESQIRNDNLVRLIRLSAKEGRPLLPEAAESLLLELRSKAKTAGDLKWKPDRDKKIITRDALREWWEKRTSELIDGASSTSGGKLRYKMTDAELPVDLIGLAMELRRNYAVSARTSKYMEPDEINRLQYRVQSEVISLSSRLVSGQLNLDGSRFHALCLDRMDAINAERPADAEDRSAFLKGCMYDIADRCLLRFARRSQ